MRHTVTFNSTRDMHFVAARHILPSDPGLIAQARRRRLLAVYPAAIGFAPVSVVASATPVHTIELVIMLSFALVWLAFCLFVAAYLWRLQPHIRRLVRAALVRIAETDIPDLPQTLVISDDGLELSGPQSSHRFTWHAVSTIIHPQGFILFMLKEWGPLILPLAAFPSPEAAAAFLADADTHRARAGSGS